MIEHIIKVAKDGCPLLISPAAVVISGGQADISAGQWPDQNGVVIDVPSRQVTLIASDRAIYLARDGDVYVSPQPLDYRPGGPLADILAWFDGTEWHVTKLEVV